MGTPYSVVDRVITKSDSGETIGGATVYVTLPGGAVASLYKNRLGTGSPATYANPFTADTDGRIVFYLDPDLGRYNFEVTSTDGTVNYYDFVVAPEDAIRSSNPVATTPTAGDNDTSIATTAFVYTAVAARTIANVAAMSTITPIADQIYTLLEYAAGTNKGGGIVIGRAGVITGNNITTFNATTGFYFERQGEVFLDSQMAGTNDAALPAGATLGVDYERTYTPHSGGTTDIRNLLVQSLINGANSAAITVNLALQSEVRHTAGTVTFAYGIQGFSRLGRLGSTTGAVTTYRGIEWHTANEGSGNIGSAYNFYSQEIDLLDGTGLIGDMKGFLCGDQGHATRITTSTIAFDCANFTAGAPLTVAFRSQMSSGTGRWAFLSSGGAASALAGAIRIGEAVAPTDALEVKGYAKISKAGTYTAAGSYHEINTSDGDYVVHVKNTHASTPHGMRVRFTGAAPNNTTQQFLLCEDSSTSRLIIWSNGNVVNNNNSYGAISDERLKTDIAIAPSVLDKFRARQFKNYRIKNSDSDQLLLGVIAQDELKISPDLVSLIPETENEPEHYSYNYAGLAVEAAQAVGELLKIVDDLQAEIKALKEAR